MEAGVAMATAFAFSTENWKRDAHEVSVRSVQCTLVRSSSKFPVPSFLDMEDSSGSSESVHTVSQYPPRHFGKCIVSSILSLYFVTIYAGGPT